MRPSIDCRRHVAHWQDSAACTSNMARNTLLVDASAVTYHLVGYVLRRIFLSNLTLYLNSRWIYVLYRYFVSLFAPKIPSTYHECMCLNSNHSNRKLGRRNVDWNSPSFHSDLYKAAITFYTGILKCGLTCVLICDVPCSPTHEKYYMERRRIYADEVKIRFPPTGTMVSTHGAIHGHVLDICCLLFVHTQTRGQTIPENDTSDL